MAKKVVIASACRTAIGKMGGALSNTPAADLGAIVIKEALNRAGVAPEMVQHMSFRQIFLLNFVKYPCNTTVFLRIFSLSA